MTAGIIQLVAVGSQDIYLIGSPNITYFKSVYRRHTNFSLETKEIIFDQKGRFDSEHSVEIKRHGDIITRMYIKIDVDEIKPSETSLMAWIRFLGVYILDYVELEIGGANIVKIPSDWIIIWYSLISKSNDRRLYSILTGAIPELISYNNNYKPSYTMYIPIPFWFNINKGSGLPLISLQYHNVIIKVRTKKREEVIIANDEFINRDIEQVRIKNISLLVEYAYLEAEERKKMAQIGQEYLMEEIQYNIETIRFKNHISDITFNHPTKVLSWCIKNRNYTSGKKFIYYTGSLLWEPEIEKASKKILSESILLIDNLNITTFNNGGFYDIVNPYSEQITTNKKIMVINKSDKYLLINTNSLKIGIYSITDKIYATIIIDIDYNIFINIDRTDITIRDLSIPIEKLIDTRFKRDDPNVYQYHNYGILIDGRYNPINRSMIQFNGLDRIKERDGNYFNYVQPYDHYISTPFDGINIYSFSIIPYLLQPSGTANFSRLDSVKLRIKIKDITKRLDSPDILNDEIELYTFGVNYNILRIISGMAGKAFSN